MASLMSLLTGHRPGAFEGFQMKDLFDKDRWEREQRTWSGQRTPTGPSDLRTNRAGEPMMTNWYKGRGTPKENRLMDESPDMFAGVNQKAFDAITLANQQRRNALWGSGGSSTVRALSPQPNIQAQRLSASPGARWSGGAALLPERVQTREVVPPTMRKLPQFSSPAQPEGALTATPAVGSLSEYFPPPPNYLQRTLDTGIPGYFGNPNADTVATEEEVEAMNAYRNQMLTDLLSETSEEPEVKAISYYKKKKRSPKTYRSKSRGYRLKRI